MIFSLLGKGYELGKWATVEGGKKVLWEGPKAVVGYTRDQLSEALEYPERREVFQEHVDEAGAWLDKTFLEPTALAVAKIFRSGPVEAAEKRLGSQKLAKIAGFAEEVAGLAGRANPSAYQRASETEHVLTNTLGDTIDRINNLRPPEPTEQERSMVSAAVQSINADRTQGAGRLKLLHPHHPLSQLALKEAMFVTQNPSKEDDFRPANITLHKPLQRDLNDAGAPEYQEERTGQKETSLWGHPRFPELSSEDRARAAEAPKVEENGQYTAALHEKKDAYTARQNVRQEVRRSLVSQPFSLRVAYGDEGYPLHGNPEPLIKLLKIRYREVFKDADWDQIAMGIYQSGDVVTIAGFVTTEQVVEPFQEASTPDVYNGQWYYDQIPEAQKKENSRARSLFESASFQSGISAHAYADLESLVDRAHQTGFAIALSVGKDPVQENDDLGDKTATTFAFSLDVNGKPEKLKLIRGTRILMVPPDSVVRTIAPKGDMVISEYMTMDQYVRYLNTYIGRGNVNMRPSSLEGDRAEGVAAAAQAPAQSQDNSADIL